MTTAKLIKTGRTQSVRLPKDCEFKGTEVSIVKVGKAVLLFQPETAWDLMQHAIDNFSDDFMASRDQPTNADQREEL